ncbi:MAG TPA: hypothetical protein VFJ79_00775 [Acidimicrobiales bacterium]|nr:hypothetical protein [Acidimicrobiales bacterium]
MAEELVAIALTDDELHILAAGVKEWLGPAHCTLEMVHAMGFESYDELESTAERFADSLPTMVLSPEDWVRAQLLTEVAFASDEMGSGLAWPTSAGYADEYTVRVLRQLQQKLGPVARRIVGRTSVPDHPASSSSNEKSAP